MKTTIDKNYTTIGMKEAVKDALKTFKASYTDNDLANAFQQQIDQSIWWCEVITAEVTAFNDCDEVRYCVDLLLKSIKEFHEVHFYCDGGLDIRTDPVLISKKTYRLV